MGQGTRPVGGGQNGDAVVALKAVYFGQKLIARLFTFVVAAVFGASYQHQIMHSRIACRDMVCYTYGALP